MGRQCVVPQLLSGVLPLAGQGALAAMLHGLCADAPDGPAWALLHPQVRPPASSADRLSLATSSMRLWFSSALWGCFDDRMRRPPHMPGISSAPMEHLCMQAQSVLPFLIKGQALLILSLDCTASHNRALSAA